MTRAGIGLLSGELLFVPGLAFMRRRPWPAIGT